MNAAGTPNLTTLSRAVRAVVTEADQLLSHNRCVFVPSQAMLPLIYSAAGLSHCCRLLEDLASAARRDAEVVARLVARAHYETWIVANYILHGGDDALNRVAGAYKKAVRTMHNELERWDARMATLADEIQRKNQRIRERNERRAARSAVDGKTRPLTPELPPLEYQPAEFDLSDSAAYNLDVPEEELKYLDIARSLGAFLRGAGEPYAEFESNYHLIYRGLSTLGSHPSLWVLDEYIDWPRNFIRVNTTFTADRLAPNATRAALLMTARLSLDLFERRDLEVPAARRVLERALAEHQRRKAEALQTVTE